MIEPAICASVPPQVCCPSLMNSTNERRLVPSYLVAYEGSFETWSNAGLIGVVHGLLGLVAARVVLMVASWPTPTLT